MRPGCRASSVVASFLCSSTYAPLPRFPHTAWDSDPSSVMTGTDHRTGAVTGSPSASRIPFMKAGSFHSMSALLCTSAQFACQVNSETTEACRPSHSS